MSETVEADTGSQETTGKGRGLAGRLWRLPLLPLLIVLVVAVCAIGADLIAPFDPGRQSLRDFLLPPSHAHLFGTDALGRDVFSRVVHGARVTMIVGLASVLLAGVIGVALGLISAVARPTIGEAIMRLVDTVLTLPAVLVALSVAATVGPSLINVILIIGCLYWAYFARMVRAEALMLREKDFVQAAISIGCSPFRLVLVHLAPNLMNTVIVVGTLQLASAILLESTLSFLGVGVPPPAVTWGTMVAEARPYVSIAWWTVTLPGLAIMATVLATNLLGDRLRDALDPRLRGR
ncbi:MAG: ABC transporter permease [Pseudorhodoplanes sp.]|uniref:ABC transporter permease n=1 Tax=Pseudorhodoplanes sp. TaxID=1934341 RepID=UPI003D0AEEB9